MRIGVLGEPGVGVLLRKSIGVLGVGGAKASSSVEEPAPLHGIDEGGAGGVEGSVGLACDTGSFTKDKLVTCSRSRTLACPCKGSGSVWEVRTAVVQTYSWGRGPMLPN